MKSLKQSVTADGTGPEFYDQIWKPDDMVKVGYKTKVLQTVLRGHPVYEAKQG